MHRSSQSQDKFPEVAITIPMFVGVVCILIIFAMEPINVHGASGLMLIPLSALLLITWLWQLFACINALKVFRRSPKSRTTTNVVFTTLGAIYLVASLVALII
jgi:hypothetical protein